MNKELKNIFLARLTSGILKDQRTKCSLWAENVRVMGTPFPGKWAFKYHPWLKEMMDTNNSKCVGQKAAQMGYTECVLNRAFYKIDIEGVNVLYVLPTKTPDATDFSASRFDPALELSEHLSKLFSDVKNVGHKRAGAVNLFVRGSKSRAGLKSLPAGFIVFDEMDEMDQDNIPLALERSSGQLISQVWMISTPTVEDFGINVHFKQSTQEHFLFKCPSCSKFIELTYPESIKIDEENPEKSYLLCTLCNSQLKHEQKHEFLKDGQWIKNHSSDVRGFYINQLYSSTISPHDFAKSVVKAKYNVADEQELYNSKLGLPHSVEGARITDALLEACRGDYQKGTKNRNGIITMGIDVGKWIHFEIGMYDFPQNIRGVQSMDMNVRCRYKLLVADKVLNFEELDVYLDQYEVMTAVCDIQPERRKAHEFAVRNYGRVKLCYYAEGIRGKMIKEDEAEQTVSVDRTSWIDMALNRFRNRTIVLPSDLQMEYKEHIKAPVRVYEKDNMGNPVARYVTGVKEDHFAHARTYSEIALAISAGQALPKTIKGI